MRILRPAALPSSLEAELHIRKRRIYLISVGRGTRRERYSVLRESHASSADDDILRVCLVSL